MSCAEGVREIRHAKQRGQTVYGETCPHYLVLSTEQAQTVNVRPPIRDAVHQTALWQGLASSNLDIVSTDHNASIRRAETPKLGASGVETRLALMHTFGVLENHFSLNQWVAMCSTTPADIFKLSTKGRLLPGYDADIVLFDPNKTVTLSADMLHSKIDYATYESLQVTGYPVTTVSRGTVLVENEEWVGPTGQGQFITRNVGKD